VTLPRVLGSWGMRRGGGVDEQAGVQPVLLRVQSGRLRVADACELIGLQRRQVFRLLRGLKQDGATSLLSKRETNPAITVCRPKFVLLPCRSCAIDTPISARPWRRRS
jgi:hypothetical protein